METAVNVSRTYTDDWEHALISGNGRQGVLCYGGPATLRLTFSHERLFLPVDEPLDPPDTGQILDQLRELCYAGRYQDAADAVVRLAVEGDPRYGELRQADPFIGAATLTIAPLGRPRAHTGWRRSVDFSTGLVEQRWADAAGTVRQEVFASRSDDVVVHRLRGEPPLSVRLTLAPIAGEPPVPIEYAARAILADVGAGAVGAGACAARLELAAQFTRHWPGSGTGYRVRCDVWWRDGAGRAEPGGVLLLTGAAEVLVLVRTEVEPAPDTDHRASLAEAPDFAALLRTHAAMHGELFGRCRLDLGDTGEATNEELLAEPPGPALVQRLFDAGRYAVISASGDLPPNLQGVWSGTYVPAWRGGYTLDGNLPAVLASAAPTGTPELLLPLFDLLDAHAADFRRNARRLFGAPGPLLPPHVTTHGRHNHFGPRWCLTFWTTAAAWMARIYEEYWRHTGDRAFLRQRAMPFLREAAEFYATVLDHRDSVLNLAPSYSPENSPAEFAATGTQAGVNATMEIAAIRWLFRTLAGLDDEAAARWRWYADRLPRYQVDPDGALAEWLWPDLSNNHAHRHASHLFGLWYEPDAQLLDDPGLREAAAAAVRARLAWWRKSGNEMAYGLFQLGLAAAALGLADEAWQTLVQLAGSYWRSSLVPTHNAGEIFNVDICGGLPALVVAMLIRARPGRVDLLPALPATWPSGAIRGVLLRDGIRVSLLRWSPTSVTVDLVSRDGGTLQVGGPAEARSISLVAGETTRASFDRRAR